MSLEIRTVPERDSTLIVKIGGSTLGLHDSTLEDVACLAGQGARVIVVHGGGPQISHWLEIHQIASRFVDGLRATDAAALEVVVAVLAGMVNKQLVAQLAALGVPAFGFCGADGAVLQAAVDRPELGLVGNVHSVNVPVLRAIIDAGLVPVIAPIGISLGDNGAQLLNVNADTVAGEIAASIPGSRLIFLTDVAGVLDADGSRLSRLSQADSVKMRASGVLKGGMLPKIDACLRASAAGNQALIVDGREPNALIQALGPKPVGTIVG